jgi:hypothetical protein
MDSDVLARRVALGAIPVLALLVYLLRSDPPAQGVGASAGAPASAASVAPSSSGSPLGFRLGAEPDGGTEAEPVRAPPAPAGSAVAPAPDRERLSALGERGLGREPLPPVQVAAHLPLLEDPTTPPPGGGGDSRSAQLTGGPCGGMRVRLITTSKDPDWSFASIAPPGQPAKLRRVGDSVGSWRVQTIEWDRVWLAAGATRCAVGMHAGAREAREAASGTSAAELLADAERDPAVWHVPVKIAQGIHKRSETEYLVTPEAADAVFERGAELFAGLRLEPVRRQQADVGVQIVELKPDSLLERLGVEPGDIVLAINDQVCSSLDASISALEAARESGVLLVRMEREGVVFDLDIRILAEEPG